MAWSFKVCVFAVSLILVVQVIADENADSTKTVAPQSLASVAIENNNEEQATKEQGTTIPVISHDDCRNGTDCKDQKNDGLGNYLKEKFTQNKAMLMRTFWVLLGVTAIVILYFGIRTVKMRRRRSKSKKYGLISRGADSMELTPLDQDDDEDDMTVFDINHK